MRHRYSVCRGFHPSKTSKFTHRCTVLISSHSYSPHAPHIHSLCNSLKRTAFNVCLLDSIPLAIVRQCACVNSHWICVVKRNFPQLLFFTLRFKSLLSFARLQSSVTSSLWNFACWFCSLCSSNNKHIKYTSSRCFHDIFDYLTIQKSLPTYTCISNRKCVLRPSSAPLYSLSLQALLLPLCRVSFVVFACLMNNKNVHKSRCVSPMAVPAVETTAFRKSWLGRKHAALCYATQHTRD